MTSPDALRSLGLAHAPVAVAFLPSPPEGLPRVERPAVSGCSYWKLAAEGRGFYTTGADHLGCPVGAFTHGAQLTPEKEQELNSLIQTMGQLQYIKLEEVPAIPHRTEPLMVAAYAPLESAPFAPDTVIFRGNARQMMILSEAARAAGVFESSAALGRPTCAMIPHAMATGGSAASLGCIGNRVYTGLADDEFYLAVPGGKVNAMLEKLGPIADANTALEQFHRERAAAAAASA